MRICKQIDPVMDIVIIGFGIRSKSFIDIFLEKNELKGVNIILICKDVFVFLDKYVQNIEKCRDSYIDIYKYCKERNILYINEKVEYIDSINKYISFSSDRNKLSYDFLLCDFDYKSSYLFSKDYSHLNIYPYKNKNLFFYYVHVMYLSLISANGMNRTDKKLYYKWKKYFLDNIVVERFYNFFSYNDKYVEEIFHKYHTIVHLNLNGSYRSTSHRNENVSVVFEEENKTTVKENETCHENDFLKKQNGEECFLTIVLISDNIDLGKSLYFELFENMKKYCLFIKIMYIHISSSPNVEKIDFCEHFLVTDCIKEVKEINKNKVILCTDCKSGDIVTVNYDECFNMTELRYPSYVYKSGYKTLNLSNEKVMNNFCEMNKFYQMNKFCQYEKDDKLYFFNQIKNYDEYTVCHTIYLNIYNSIHKKKYISIEDVKKNVHMSKKNGGNATISLYSSIEFNNILNYLYVTIVEIIRAFFHLVCKNKFVQKKVHLIKEKKKRIDKYFYKSKMSAHEETSIPLLVTLLLYIYSKVVIYIHILKGIFPVEGEEQGISGKKNEGDHSSSNDGGSTSCSRRSSRSGIESDSKIICSKRVNPFGSNSSICNTSNNAHALLPAYMYEFYQKEYEKRLSATKRTTYKIVRREEEKNSSDNSSLSVIIVEQNNIRGEKSNNLNSNNNYNVMSCVSKKKVDLYIKESIDKIINRNTCGGCGSKVPSNVLSNSLKLLDIYNSSNVYLGVEGCDDCCIFVHSKSKRGENSPAIVQTIDFFKSFIDDEYILGEIIAIHCLSDIYSMGGIGICALCVLIVKDNIEIKLQQRLENILTGCCQKLKEEKCVLSGGHTCAGNENYVGLAVTGKIKKKIMQRGDNIMEYIGAKKEQMQKVSESHKIVKDKEDAKYQHAMINDTDDNKVSGQENNYENADEVALNMFKKQEMLKENYLFLPKGSRNINAGDVIITTKMFGFGFIMAAHLCKKAKARWVYNCLDEMLISNKKGGLYFLKNNVKACTDVTGFGILGHLNEMIKCSRRDFYLSNRVPDVLNNGLFKNHEERRNDVDMGETRVGAVAVEDSNTGINTLTNGKENGEAKIRGKYKENDKNCRNDQNGKNGKNSKNSKPINFIGAKIKLSNIIIAEGVQDCIENNIYSSMYKKNHYLCNNIINLEEALLNDKYGVLFDPQTSGGLMAIVEREEANKILQDLKNIGYKNSSIIGEIINVQYDKFKYMSINEVSLDDYLDTSDSIYIEC
ncbi:selenide water dikinase [Plasmodium brasilianum]|uniref:Selenide water dikinase, putative n=2 Tax=Plasmodium (Plasmodium) TaxID=418103 RepID=A0A1D3JMA0_PLAMA|nr:selenide water dikinase, putative [Plasmodium malariae]KAI4839345.1 selenide water dikinase [Plasmodium brasilianum]SBT87759.1 selenide water dikinase, putative [Plasmodium malariae]